jgi:hypothetical protein
VPRLLRRAFGIAVPPYIDAAVADGSFNQAAPVERRADLVVHLRDGRPLRAPVMGIVVEVQRRRDEAKRRSWPLYVAALHDRLRCPTCLVVIAADDAVARWAATPITTVQPGSPFTPLVLGAADVPGLSVGRARREPWLAVLAGLVHGNRPGGAAATLTAFAALDALSGSQAKVCYDLLQGALTARARRALEQAMLTLSGKYEYQSEFARRYVAEGRKQGRQEGRLEAARTMVVSLAARRGPLAAALRARVEACTDLALLHAVALDVAAAADRPTVARLLARVPHITTTAGPRPRRAPDRTATPRRRSAR